MMLLYVAWIAFWQAISDPCLWTEAASAHEGLVCGGLYARCTSSPGSMPGGSLDNERSE
jgi:hypothetical protein